MPRPLERGILGASTIILSKYIDKYALCVVQKINESDIKMNIQAVACKKYYFSWNPKLYSNLLSTAQIKLFWV
jgi:hypothetical protein